MPSRIFLPARKGKWSLVWAVLFIGCAQLGMSLFLNVWRPELRDPAFGLRLRALWKRRAENPSAPLVLLLGSSRTMHGLSPACLAVSPNREGATPLVYNFSLPGAGSILELMIFRRLRAAGIKPDWLLIEVWPVQWPEDGYFAERLLIVDDELYWSDLTVLSRYLPGKRQLFARALRTNLAPLVHYRNRLLHTAAHFLLPRDQDRGMTLENDAWTCADGFGWLPYRRLAANSAAQQGEVEKGRWLAAPLLNPLRLSADYDGALRELLDECRASGIKTALFLMPEHSECRRWYSPQTHALVNDYLRQLSAEYAAPVIDTRDWVPDEHFADFCHMAPWGAAPFSERFGRQVLRPLLAQEWRDIHSFLPKP